jgi:hypothetical protein
MNSPASDQQDATLEAALAVAEQDAAVVLKLAGKVAGALKAMQTAAREGDLRKLRSAPEAIRRSRGLARGDCLGFRRGGIPA